MYVCVFLCYCMCWSRIFSALRTFAFSQIPSGESSLTSISLKITRNLYRWRCAQREGGRVKNHGGCEYSLVRKVTFAHTLLTNCFNWANLLFCAPGLRLTCRHLRLMRSNSTPICWTQEKAEWCFWSPWDPSGGSPSLTSKMLPCQNLMRKTKWWRNLYVFPFVPV